MCQDFGNTGEDIVLVQKYGKVVVWIKNPDKNRFQTMTNKEPGPDCIFNTLTITDDKKEWAAHHTSALPVGIQINYDYQEYPRKKKIYPLNYPLKLT